MTSTELNLRIRLSSVTLSNGAVLHLTGDEALLVVGPNNAGKSQLLRDIESLAGRTLGGTYDGKVAKEISFFSPSNNEVFQFFKKYKLRNADFYHINGLKIHQFNIQSAFGMGHVEQSFGEAARIFVKRVSSDDRLSIVAPSPALTEEGPQTPGQLLYDSEELVERVSELFYRAFKKQVFLNYRAGAEIPIHVGVKPIAPKGADRVSDAYVNLVRATDKLHEQGDGMRSFGGIILSTMVNKYNVTLVDEPEAFLHPPQERLIGKIIAEEAGGQVICSTHSSNIVRGFLESRRKNTRVMRITRDDRGNHVTEISADEIEELWVDPVFRYSTALDALFHDRAILCEAEPDCKFYEAIMDHVKGESSIDSHFIPCAGKAAFPKFSKALRKLGVSVISILDLDVLNDEGTIKRIYEAQGGDWHQIAHIWRRLDAAVRKGIRPDDALTTKAKISNVLDTWTEGNAPISAINEILNLRKPWGFVKEHGLAAVPAGDAQLAAADLIVKLSEVSVFPIPVGTVEKFVRTVGNHGNKWLAGVLAKYDLDAPELASARDFVSFAL